MTHIPKEFSERFRARTKLIRESAGMTQTEVAKELGITHSQYIKYELRSPLPTYLIVPFLKATGADFQHLFGPIGRPKVGRRVADRIRPLSPKTAGKSPKKRPA